MDNAPWAPAWIGLVVTPWLAFAFAAGAAVDRATVAGLVALSSVAAAYLLLSGSDAAGLWPQVIALALVGGSVLGWAGGAWRRGHRAGLVVIGLALLVEGLVLQLGERSPLERAAFAAESCLGLVVCFARASAQGPQRFRRRGL